MAKRLAKSFMSESEETAASSNFTLCMVTLTQAQATVEGRKAENLWSADTPNVHNNCRTN